MATSDNTAEGDGQARQPHSSRASSPQGSPSRKSLNLSRTQSGHYGHEARDKDNKNEDDDGSASGPILVNQVQDSNDGSKTKGSAKDENDVGDTISGVKPQPEGDVVNQVQEGRMSAAAANQDRDGGQQQFDRASQTAQQQQPQRPSPDMPRSPEQQVQQEPVRPKRRTEREQRAQPQPQPQPQPLDDDDYDDEDYSDYDNHGDDNIQQQQSISGAPNLGQLAAPQGRSHEVLGGLLGPVTDTPEGNGQMQQQQQPATDAPAKKSGSKDDTLKLRLDLNLDVDVQIRARVHGDVTLSLL